ncbi:MAG: hypothetical protein IJ039_02515 [Clostridia bacterium]|nr:hypothetical protein [Clostridia bacterium]
MKNKKSKNKKNRKQSSKDHSKITVLALIGCILLFMPVAALGIVNHFLGAPGSAWIIIGYGGAFIIGVGLFNTIMSLVKMSFGIKVTSICFIIGGILIAISELLVFNSHLFDEDIVNYYFSSNIFVIATLIPYWMFRGGVDSYLHNCKGLSKTNINKRKKGKRNFWWYEELHKELNIGTVYYFNKIYTILFACVFPVNLALGAIKATSVITCPLSLILYAFTAIMLIFASIQFNKEEHGTAFVLLAKRYNGGISSSIIDLIMLFLPLGMAYAHILLAINIWQ